MVKFTKNSSFFFRSIFKMQGNNGSVEFPQHGMTDGFSPEMVRDPNSDLLLRHRCT